MEKKGVFDISPAIVIGLIASIGFVIIAILFGRTIINSIFSVEKPECANNVEWEKLTIAFKELEKGSDEETVFLYNEECPLATFSLKAEYEIIKPGFNPLGKPRICLCKTEKVEDDIICKPYDCYKFSKFDEIKSEEGKQFTTYEKKQYAFLRFKKEDKTLVVSGALEDINKPEKETDELNIGNERNPSDINTIILHHTGGHTAESAISTLEERELSVHYIIDKKGVVQNLVSENFIAFHVKGDNGLNNKRSIGIEIVNTGSKDDDFTEEQYASIRILILGITGKYNIPYDSEHIKAHYEMPGNTDKWDVSPNFDWSKIGISKLFSREYCIEHNLQKQGYNCEELEA